MRHVHGGDTCQFCTPTIVLQGRLAVMHRSALCICWSQLELLELGNLEVEGAWTCSWPLRCSFWPRFVKGIQVVRAPMSRVCLCFALGMSLVFLGLAQRCCNTTILGGNIAPKTSRLGAVHRFVTSVWSWFGARFSSLQLHEASWRRWTWTKRPSQT